MCVARIQKNLHGGLSVRVTPCLGMAAIQLFHEQRFARAPCWVPILSADGPVHDSMFDRCSCDPLLVSSLLHLSFSRLGLRSRNYAKSTPARSKSNHSLNRKVETSLDVRRAETMGCVQDLRRVHRACFSRYMAVTRRRKCTRTCIVKKANA